MSRSSSEIQKIGLYVIRVLLRARLSRGAGKAEIKPGRLAGRLGTGVRSQPRMHKQDRGEVEDQDLRKNFEQAMGITFADAALSSAAGKVTQENDSSLRELGCSGFVVIWACTVLELCRCFRGLAAE